MTDARPTHDLDPVFLEPRDDYWEIHVPEMVDAEDQREYHLAPLATAERLPTAIYCEDCFPERASEE